ncbi:biotin transporter BioY [Lachnospiraceae bacterium WCA-9-b2]|jgi:biotin transport system substrate-specific component|uniref:Biotin transporter n=1 Tax=Sporofaciens musculi TaxID=2681861 RepID=A0A7X3SKW5_9FIRM|nr:biotin transporter BioY [Sporofaciens musculi]MXP77786.1 biotin transporter BioY [Sporofaciens musculi]
MLNERQFLSIREMTAGGLFAALIASGAFIKVTLPTEPFPMHFTLQWFFVLLAGLLLNKRLAGASVGVYLLVGLSGVPVFAAGGGPSYLLRPTFGYLLGFAVSAYMMAWMCENIRILNYMKLLLVSTAGLLVYYGIGMLYYWLVCRILISQEVTWQILLFQCFLLTVGEDFILCVAAVSVAAKLRGLIRRTLY